VAADHRVALRDRGQVEAAVPGRQFIQQLQRALRLRGAERDPELAGIVDELLLLAQAMRTTVRPTTLDARYDWNAAGS
jgi:hypothetical protein